MSFASHLVMISLCACIGIQKLSSIKDKQGSKSDYNYDEVEMRPYSEVQQSHSKFTIEAQYEECGVGVTSSGVTMEENPAYQPVDHR